jgi:hypothetical protein
VAAGPRSSTQTHQRPFLVDEEFFLASQEIFLRSLAAGSTGLDAGSVGGGAPLSASPAGIDMSTGGGAPGDTTATIRAPTSGVMLTVRAEGCLAMRVS